MIPSSIAVNSSPMFRLGIVVALSLAPNGLARGDDLPTYEITLKDHKFTPDEIHVATGKPFIVVVTNADGGADEFEMLIPALEKTLQPGQQGKLRMRPLGPGRFRSSGNPIPTTRRVSSYRNDACRPKLSIEASHEAQVTGVLDRDDDALARFNVD